MNIVSVMAASGGSGATTIAAHLAASLAARRRHVLAVDLCPDNALRLHFGMTWTEPAGLADQVLAGRPGVEAAYLSSGGVSFLAFGAVHDEQRIMDFSARLSERPGGLATCFENVELEPDAVVVADIPRFPWSLARQALAPARLVLVAVQPDGASLANLPRALDTAVAAGPAQVAVVLNGFDTTRELDRDIALLLSSRPQYRLAPVRIHRDESVREALACKQTVFDYAPSSQAGHDFTALATWVIARLGHLRER